MISRNSHVRARVATMVALLMACAVAAFSQELTPGNVAEISFSGSDLPPTLHSMMIGLTTEPVMTVRLPDDYDAAKAYPLLVYVPGFDGGVKGNIGNAQAIAGTRGWIVASLPLFKKTVDRSEVAGGLPVGLEDYPAIARAYETMLGKLFAMIPNIDTAQSAMVGFSNGALTIAVLLSLHNEFILTHFKNYCLVDQGMFHLMDLHKKYARDCRYLVLAGDREDMGRQLKIRQGQLLQDEMKVLGVNLSFEILKDTGHEFQERHMAIVGRWLRREPE